MIASLLIHFLFSTESSSAKEVSGFPPPTPHNIPPGWFQFCSTKPIWQPQRDYTEFESQRARIKDAFMHSWKSYEQYAWGADELHPLSKKPNNWLGGLGTTIIDSLSTIHLFANDALFSSAREFIANDLEFDRPRCGSRFEITIRILGGLLSAFDLTGDEVFLRKAEEIGTEIIEGFQDEWIVAPEMEMCFGKNPEPAEEDSFWDDYTEEDEATEKKKRRYNSMNINNYENKKKDHSDPLIPNGSTTLADACLFMELAALGDRVWMMANIDAMVDHIEENHRNDTESEQDKPKVITYEEILSLPSTLSWKGKGRARANHHEYTTTPLVIVSKVTENTQFKGTYPAFVDTRTGHFSREMLTVGAYGDSFYEYLIKGSEYFGMSGRSDVVKIHQVLKDDPADQTAHPSPNDPPIQSEDPTDHQLAHNSHSPAASIYALCHDTPPASFFPLLHSLLWSEGAVEESMETSQWLKKEWRKSTIGFGSEVLMSTQGVCWEERGEEESKAREEEERRRREEVMKRRERRENERKQDEVRRQLEKEKNEKEQMVETEKLKMEEKLKNLPLNPIGEQNKPELHQTDTNPVSTGQSTNESSGSTHISTKGESGSMKDDAVNAQSQRELSEYAENTTSDSLSPPSEQTSTQPHTTPSSPLPPKESQTDTQPSKPSTEPVSHLPSASLPLHPSSPSSCFICSPNAKPSSLTLSTPSSQTCSSWADLFFIPCPLGSQRTEHLVFFFAGNLMLGSRYMNNWRLEKTENEENDEIVRIFENSDTAMENASLSSPAVTSPPLPPHIHFGKLWSDLNTIGHHLTTTGLQLYSRTRAGIGMEATLIRSGETEMSIGQNLDEDEQNRHKAQNLKKTTESSKSKWETPYPPTNGKSKKSQKQQVIHPAITISSQTSRKSILSEECEFTRGEERIACVSDVMVVVGVSNEGRRLGAWNATVPSSLIFPSLSDTATPSAAFMRSRKKREDRIERLQKRMHRRSSICSTAHAETDIDSTQHKTKKGNSNSQEMEESGIMIGRNPLLEPHVLSSFYSTFLSPPNQLPLMQAASNEEMNLLRPELVESLFYSIRTSVYSREMGREEEVRQQAEWVLDMFLRTAKVDNGFACVRNCVGPEWEEQNKNGTTDSDPESTHLDLMPSYWLGETLKYLYLCFTPPSTVLPLDIFVLTTEAQPIVRREYLHCLGAFQLKKKLEAKGWKLETESEKIEREEMVKRRMEEEARLIREEAERRERERIEEEKRNKSLFRRWFKRKTVKKHEIREL
ncbi:putative Mannosyl-oligosaccharide 1,2-alpha-mannosidase MNS2 [Blattamonas nauphoetae]|uniref:alpha-1,2-Mannosidase n=1 Tax=Blattamonas nauphoetae TaxID=2049346 RepID=A0ABQ9Y1M7_9EUKA|nr:putative Mannosyl-oligosaccharide 1,2-alpha-mannosidase MNS2 [Blattamonas nauphoetae]